MGGDDQRLDGLARITAAGRDGLIRSRADRTERHPSTTPSPALEA